MIEIFAVSLAALIVVLLVIVLSRRFKNYLSVRIALLILGTAPLVLISLTIFNILYARSTPGWLRLLQVSVVVFGTPLLMGWLASRYVTRPLKNFTDAIQSLKDNNYHTELQDAGIVEFNTVFAEFNDLRKRLRQEEELRKNLISDTSHELNTPLMAMVSQLSAMDDGLLPMDKEHLTLIKMQAERLSNLIAQLAAYTKARTPGAFSETKAVRLQEVGDRLAITFKPMLLAAGMKLQLVMSPELVVTANAASLEQVLINLIQNAIRYSHGTVLTIQADTKQLLVSDNGKGVPEESLAYLFERFYRVDPSRNRTSGGLGLGLAIVRELVIAQGWRIDLENTKPGFRVTISF